MCSDGVNHFTCFLASLACLQELKSQGALIEELWW